jgi:hypothetical protein
VSGFSHSRPCAFIQKRTFKGFQIRANPIPQLARTQRGHERWSGETEEENPTRPQRKARANRQVAQAQATHHAPSRFPVFASPAPLARPSGHKEKEGGASRFLRIPHATALLLLIASSVGFPPRPPHISPLRSRCLGSSSSRRRRRVWWLCGGSGVRLSLERFGCVVIIRVVWWRRYQSLFGGENWDWKLFWGALASLLLD